MKDLKLETCPFCGGEVELYKYTEVIKCKFICKTCKVEIDFPRGLDSKTCIKRYNTRVNIAPNQNLKATSTDNTEYTMCMEGTNQFKMVGFKPTCPHGYIDCVWDPAYIKATYPSWYLKLYGDTEPKDNPCEQCPNGERYDDEDK